jgi:hypothetical protein
MLPYTLGSEKYRSGTVDAQIVRLALRRGMKAGSPRR